MSESIEIPDSADCAFCDYLAGRRPYSIVHRGTLTATLVTREQRGVAHLLVVPIRHVPTLLELDDEEAGALMVALRSAGIAIDLAEARPGLSVWQNNGISANQSVGHLHFHIAGTLPGGGTEFGDVRELTVEETDQIAERIVPFLPATNRD